VSEYLRYYNQKEYTTTEAIRNRLKFDLQEEDYDFEERTIEEMGWIMIQENWARMMAKNHNLTVKEVKDRQKKYD